MYEGYNNQIDFSKSVPGFHTVAQYALMLAIYCGFNEIYLIGCDMTGYREVEEKAYGNYDEDKHCYHLTEDERKMSSIKGEHVKSTLMDLLICFQIIDDWQNMLKREILD